MAKPSIVQKLKNGLILCKKNFPAFVDTWNWVVDRTSNLKGDADVQGQKGKGAITVDNTDSSHPVIRFIDDGRFADCKGDADISSSGEGFYNTKSIKTISAYNYSTSLSGNASCKVYQLNNFGTGGKVNPILSSDDVLVRRSISGNYSLEYVSMSKLSGGGMPLSGDADLYPCTFESIQSCEREGQRYLELFGFDQFENVMSYDDVQSLANNNNYATHLGSILIRENTSAGAGEDCAHTLKYADMRDIYPYADSEWMFEECDHPPFNMTYTKSVEKNGPNSERNVFQLYGFDWGSDEDSREYVEVAKQEDYCTAADCITKADLIFRRTYTDEDGCDRMMLMYTDLNRLYVHADTEAPFNACGCHDSYSRSIDAVNWRAGHQCVVQYHQLHNFTAQQTTEPLSSGMDVLVRKFICTAAEQPIAELNYVPISSFTTIVPDACIANCTKSLAKDASEEKTLRLYNFDKTAFDQMPCETQYTAVLCRHTVCGDPYDENHLEYYPLSNFLSGGGGGTPDSCVANCTKSLEKNGDVMRLYGFGSNGTNLTSTVDLSAYFPAAKNGSSKTQFLCRDGGVLKYAELQMTNGVCFKGNSCDSGAEYLTGMRWQFESMNDSNIKIKVTGGTIRIGAYYI